MPPATRGGGGAGGGGRPGLLMPGLFVGCLLLSLFFLTPHPFLYGGGGSSRGGSGGGGLEAGAGGHGSGGEADLLLRGKQTQRAAGVPPHQGRGPGASGPAAVLGQPVSTEGLLRYFAEAHRKVGWGF